MQGTNDIGLAYIGDGAVEEGVVQESLNLAKVQNAPMLWFADSLKVISFGYRLLFPYVNFCFHSIIS